MKSFNRKLVLSFITLLLSVATLTTTTFAWFNLTDFGMLDGLELNVTGDQLLFVSIDGENFKQSLTYNDLKPFVEGVRLDAVTSSNGFDVYSKTGHLTKQNYISFPLWFRTTNNTYNGLYLTDDLSKLYNYETALNYNFDGTYVFSKGVKWQADCTFNNGDEIVDKGVVKTYFATEALRIGITEVNLEDSFNTNKPSDYINHQAIFDLSNNPSRSFGCEFGAIDREKVILGRLPERITSQSVITTLSGFKNPYEVVDDTSLVARFFEGNKYNDYKTYYAKVMVNIWLEGWDPDCFDSITNDLLLIQLSFKQAMNRGITE